VKALVLRKEPEFSCGFEQVQPPAASTPGSVCSLAYSCLNYKDALAIANRGPVVRKWPMVPGIDGAGTITESSRSDLPSGSDVILTGWGLGEARWGCLAEAVWIDEANPVVVADSLSPRHAMAVGTAGLTAMLCIQAIERHGVKPQDGPVLVTGASGGVGGMALMFLKGLGYHAVASTGRPEGESYLKEIGAAEVIDRASLASPGKPLQPERWAAVIDSLGDVTLANACASTEYRGIVAACGLAQGMNLPTTVAPFILRGVTLAGIDSVMVSNAVRIDAWRRIAHLANRALLDRMTREIAFADVVPAAHELLAGRVRGRLVVNLRR